MPPPTLENPKLFTLNEAVAARERLLANGRRLVLTNGVFDLLHTGHLYYLRKARELGDALYVALNSDQSVKQLKGPLRPVQSELERAFALAALSCVDGVVIFREKRLTSEINALHPDVYCKAGDYNMEKLDPGERDALVQAGTQVVFLAYLEGFSTTALIGKIKTAGGI